VTTQQDVQITPVNSVGIASISLRGFGPNRSLVLVDGKRIVPINALMVTDINAIPSALIERVETITGGASAVYGGDAVGGVTNFILRDDFEGFDLDLQHGATQEGDGEESRVAIVMGTNFADGRCNVILVVEKYNRKVTLEFNHDRYRARMADPRVHGSFVFLQGVNGYNCRTFVEGVVIINPFTLEPMPNCPNLNTVRTMFDAEDGFYGPGFFDQILYGAEGFSQFAFNPDGTIFVNNRNGVHRAKLPLDGLEDRK